MAGGFASLPLDQLLDDLSSAEPSPASGWATAVVVATASALVAMAARASASGWSEAGGFAAQAEALRTRALELAEEVDEAYRAALDVLEAPPGETAAVRDFAIAGAVGRAADVPLAIARAATDAAVLGAHVAERGEQSRHGDSVAAVLLAEGAARAAANLVEINLTTVPEDPRLKEVSRLLDDAKAAGWRAVGERWEALH